MSRRSIRRARETSWSAASSATLPISLKYMRMGSLLAVLIEVESRSLAFIAVAAGQRPIAFDDVDAEVVEEQEDVVDLIGREIDVLQCVADVFGVQVALTAALDEQPAHFVDGCFCRFGRAIGCGQINHRLVSKCRSRDGASCGIPPGSVGR